MLELEEEFRIEEKSGMFCSKPVSIILFQQTQIMSSCLIDMS